MRRQTIILNLTELEARLEQVECSLSALRKPLHEVSQTITELRRKNTRARPPVRRGLKASVRRNAP